MDKLIVLREAFNLIFDDSDSEEDLFKSDRSIVKNKNYAELVVPNFSDQTFKSHFRITPTVFECCDIHEIFDNIYEPGRISVMIEKKLMITLWYLGNQECMR